MMTRLIKKLPFFKKETAQTMVEFALVFPIVLLITYGIIEFGRMVFIYAVVTGSAREGARYGAAAGDINGTMTRHYMDCTGIKNAVRKVEVLVPIPDADITLWYDSGPGTAHKANACPPTDSFGMDKIRLGDRIGVRVQVHYQPIIAFLGINGFNIVAQNARTILVNLQIK